MNEQRSEDAPLAVGVNVVKHFKSGQVIVKAVDGVSFQLPLSAVVALRAPAAAARAPCSTSSAHSIGKTPANSPWMAST